MTSIFYLSRVADQERFLQAFCAAETVLLAFPLYTDAMPGLVKEFMETLGSLCRRAGNPALGILGKSGFPEAAQVLRSPLWLPNLGCCQPITDFNRSYH